MNSWPGTSWSSCRGSGRPGTGPECPRQCACSPGSARLFPGQPWQSGARLVSDFRFLRRPRAFPERDLGPQKVLAHLREQELPAAVLTQVERVLAGRNLSRFQLSATSEIFSGLQSRTDRGVVVGAGTGSGKTLAFYLPALSQLAAAGAAGPRVVAIYPRNELLKDQLATALREVRGLRSAGSRTLDHRRLLRADAVPQRP